MFNPYFLMTVLFVSLAVLSALAAALASWHIAPWFDALRWLRVHLITLGTLTEVIFGVLPGLVAARANRPRPGIRWDIWFTLNGGLITLLVGIPLVNAVLIFTGGTLIFSATLLLIKQLRDMHPSRPAFRPGAGRPFYLAGLSYFLLGIFLGTGLWLGWGKALNIGSIVEVHIHANNWGFLSLVFAGLLIDLYPALTKQQLAWPRSIKPIFWLMTLGALGLVLGPWFKSEVFTVPGLIMHLTATLWLLLNVIKPVLHDRAIWRPGWWHLMFAYIWILAPVLVAPLILLQVPGFPGAGIEGSAPQALIYGWVLQFGYALLPYFFTRAFTPDRPATLGGNWFSVITVQLGGVCLWASIFLQDYQALLHGLAYALWLLSALPIVTQLWRIVRDAIGPRDEADLLTVSGE
jgi:hypothetical protein